MMHVILGSLSSMQPKRKDVWFQKQDYKDSLDVHKRYHLLLDDDRVRGEPVAYRTDLCILVFVFCVLIINSPYCLQYTV